MKIVERESARALRKRGHTINHITRQLGVSKSSVSLWVRDIVLTDEQRLAIGAQHSFATTAARNRMIDAARLRRLEWQAYGRQEARSGDVLLIKAAMLYWAEGTKKNNRCSIRFTNSDPHMISLFVQFLQDCYGMAEGKIRLALHMYTDICTEQQAKEFWMQHTGFQKPPFARRW